MKHKTFKDYLIARGYSKATVRDYTRKNEAFLSWTGQKKLSLKQVQYKDLLELVRHCKMQGHRPKAINTILRVVRLYYKYRGEAGEQLESPAIGLTIKGSSQRLPHDLLEWEDLEKIYQEYEVTGARSQRDKTILGLLSYQAVRLEELEKLKDSHLKLKEGKIEVPGGPRSNRRILPLQASQVLELQEYQEKTKKKLLQEKKRYTRWEEPVEAARLFFGTAGDRKLGNTVQKLMDSLREKYPEHSKFTATKIRESVIVHWLKSKDVRTVQYMAGHKYELNGTLPGTGLRALKRTDRSVPSIEIINAYFCIK